MPGPLKHARTEAGAHPPRRGGLNSHLGRAVDRRGREVGGPGIGGPSGVPRWRHQWPWAAPASLGPGPCLGLEGHGAQPRGGGPLRPPARLAPALDSLRSLCPFWVAWVCPAALGGPGRPGPLGRRFCLALPTPQISLSLSLAPRRPGPMFCSLFQCSSPAVLSRPGWALCPHWPWPSVLAAPCRGLAPTLGRLPTCLSVWPSAGWAAGLGLERERA